MAFHRTEFPRFNWSESRERRRLGCMRSDYLATFGQHNGWERGAPASVRATWTMGKLTSVEALVGAAVHRRATEITQFIQAGKPMPSVGELYAESAYELNAAIRASRDGRQAFLRAPTSVPMLEEIFYRNGPSSHSLARLRERLDRALRHLAHADRVWTAVRDAGPDVVLMDRFASFVLRPDGITVYACADLILRRQPRRGASGAEQPWVCVDWKTSGTDGAVDQLLTYALAMREGLQLEPWHPVRGSSSDPAREAGDELAYEGWVGSLAHGELHQVAITDGDIASAAARIRAAACELRTYLEDPAANIPRPIEAFPKTKNPARCSRCVYRGRCHPTLYPTPWAAVFAPEVES